MSRNNRLVCVDDTDSSIKWDGAWFSKQGIKDDRDNRGPPFLGTLTETTTSGTLKFSFRGMDTEFHHGTIQLTWAFLFTGTSISVRGSIQPQSISNREESGDAKWECLLDGEPIEGHRMKEDRWLNYRSNFRLCSQDDLPRGDHTFELKATARSGTLWVDQIQYLASPDADVSSRWTKVSYKDASFKYSGDWREDDQGTATLSNSSSFTYDFDGQGVIFGGYTPGKGRALDGLAVYSLDSGIPVEFRIPASTKERKHQPYFNITAIQPGNHSLTVVNKGNDSTAPLAFSYIYTKSGPMQAAPPSYPNSTPDAPAEPSITDLPSAKPSVEAKPDQGNGGIIGGAVGGGLAAILLAALLCFIIIRNRRRRERVLRAWFSTPKAFVAEARTNTQSVVLSDSWPPPTVSTISDGTFNASLRRPSHAALTSSCSSFYTDPGANTLGLSGRVDKPQGPYSGIADRRD